MLAPSSCASCSARSKASRTPGSTCASPPGPQLRGHAEAHALEALRARQRDLPRELQRGGVAAVAAHHVPEHQRGVGDVARERTRLVERGGEGDHPEARDRPAYQLRAESSVTYSEAWARRTNAYSLPPGSQVSARTKPPRNGARRAGSMRSNVRLPRCRSRPRLTIVEPAVKAADCAR